MLTIDVIIPIYRPDEKLEQLITRLYRQTIKPSSVILLHTLEYEKQELALPIIDGSNIHIHPIQKKDFDHGGTRKLGAKLSEAEFMLYMTQDAVPTDEFLIERLMEPFEDSQVSATYARQLPDHKADETERYTRLFNYPDTDQVKSLKDLEVLGIKTFFCSNVCAAYRKSVYQELGGFVDKTIFNEDMIMASVMIRAGYRIAYAAQAKVVHSHKYSYLQQFTRNFDLGVSHNQYAVAFRGVKSETEGIKLVRQTINYLVENKKYFLIPDLIINSGMKYLGYQLGIRYDILPRSLVIRFSMNKGYWNER